MGDGHLLLARKLDGSGITPKTDGRFYMFGKDGEEWLYVELPHNMRMLYAEGIGWQYAERVKF